MSMSTGLRNGLKSTGMDLLQIPKGSMAQSSLFNQSLEQSRPGINKTINQWSRLAGGGDEDLWSQLAAPALREQGMQQGALASRFSGGFGQGGSGMRHSSGFRNTMNQSNIDLAERLQGQRLGLQQGAQDRLMNLFQQLMGHSENENVLAPESIPFWKQLSLALASGGSQALGSIGGTYGIKKLGLLG